MPNAEKEIYVRRSELYQLTASIFYLIGLCFYFMGKESIFTQLTGFGIAMLGALATFFAIDQRKKEKQTTDK